MLSNHPPPETNFLIEEILKALYCLKGDRINSYSNIPYSSIVIYVDRNIHYYDVEEFEDYLIYADNVAISKVLELEEMRRKDKEFNK